MALVDYSESESSDSEKERPATRPALKKRVVDHRGKIIVNLPPPPSSSTTAQGSSSSSPPPAKRARTSGSGLFSGFNSLLPPPKKTTRSVALKTSTEPGFDRGADNGSSAAVDAQPPAETCASPPQPTPPSNGDKPPQTQEKAPQSESIGKPTMFKPLSVARSAHKKKTKTSPAAKAKETHSTPSSPAPTPKKQSLFSLHTEIEASTPKIEANSVEYSTAPLLDTASVSTPAAEPGADDGHPLPPHGQTHRLDTIANDLNLSAAARRELFGRNASINVAQPVINYNMDDEYQRNEQLRAAGEQQTHNPVRAIQGGKHNLRQLVQNVQSQRDALEDSFAQGKSNRKDASSRYGWR
ncbi:hypothetical protein L249_7986 [Ophiocordyceps polyrhachis-furcata BCC 54312]|uniref:Uncharacterized protein n=1 Tax=Ophiocordyceps polyrhachis-furcata BCC 54312 TaxID=1330021 RepID=A0A367LH56_9HYPO|nr:hypothetical protein L249_7986 [Ophiocordyceps polyrhachis-furcata BCC 54312]